MSKVQRGKSKSAGETRNGVRTQLSAHLAWTSNHISKQTANHLGQPAYILFLSNKLSVSIEQWWSPDSLFQVPGLLSGHRLSAAPYASTARQAGGKLSSYKIDVPKGDLSQRQCHFCTEVAHGVVKCLSFKQCCLKTTFVLTGSIGVSDRITTNSSSYKIKLPSSFVSLQIKSS